MDKADLTPALCRAARALLDWSQEDLAERALVVSATIRGFELGHKSPRRASLSAMQRAFKDAGVTFATDAEHGVGAFLAARKEIKQE